MSNYAYVATRARSRRSRLLPSEAYNQLLNVELSEKWRDNNITEMKDAPADAEEWDGVPNKLQYLER